MARKTLNLESFQIVINKIANIRGRQYGWLLFVAFLSLPQAPSPRTHTGNCLHWGYILYTKRDE